MKFVILLLAFSIPLLTSTGGLMCFKCDLYECNNYNLDMAKGIECTGAEETHCVTWFTADGRVKGRGCIDPDPRREVFSISTNYVKKTGCQNLKNKHIDITKRLCLCNKDNCNIDTKSPSNTGNGNTCNIVGMSRTTFNFAWRSTVIITPYLCGICKKPL